jgi:hypothetical protein
MKAVTRHNVSVVVATLLQVTGGSGLLKIWHFRHDWLFTPFVVVVGGKYFFAGAGVPSF